MQLWYCKLQHWVVQLVLPPCTSKLSFSSTSTLRVVSFGAFCYCSEADAYNQQPFAQGIEFCCIVHNLPKESFVLAVSIRQENFCHIKCPTTYSAAISNLTKNGKKAWRTCRSCVLLKELLARVTFICFALPSPTQFGDYLSLVASGDHRCYDFHLLQMIRMASWVEQVQGTIHTLIADRIQWCNWWSSSIHNVAEVSDFEWQEGFRPNTGVQMLKAVGCSVQFTRKFIALLVKSIGSVYRDRKFPFRTNWKIMYFGEWSRNGTRKLNNLDLVMKKANELWGVGDEEEE